MLWRAVAPELRPNEDWPAFNRRLQRFAIATIWAAPVSYAAWVVGASSRLVGHALVLNPCFLLAATGLLLLANRTPRDTANWRVLIILVGAYTVGTGALAVLVTFPASRYVDSAAMLLAALPFYGVLRRIA